jgi:hypothetical protein
LVVLTEEKSYSGSTEKKAEQKLRIDLQRHAYGIN